MALPASAQQRRISGTVSDDIDVIIGANVAEYDKNNRIVSQTVTDMNGNFTMNIKDPNNTIKISYIGYHPHTEKIGSKTKFTVTLKDATKTLNTLDVVAKAKAANMPNDNINRAIKKAAEAGEGDDYEEITYEGYGPAGVAIMVKTLTNNRNRTAADLRHIFDKNGGNLGVDGSVSFLFNEKGTILISKEDYEDEDQVMADALDCGASDFDSDDEFYIISTATSDYYDVRDALEAKNYTIADSTLGPVAMTTAEVTDPDAVAQLEKMLDMMDENEDIQEVFHNWNG